MKKTKQIILIGFLILVSILSASNSSRAVEKSDIADFYKNSFQNEAKGDYDAALNDMIQILRLNTENYIALLRAGWLSYKKRNYEESISHYQHACNLAPKAIEPELGMMMPMMALKMWTRAERSALRILKKDHENYLARSRLAYIQYSTGQYLDSIKNYRRLLMEYPGDIDMRLGLAWCYIKTGKKKEAIPYIKQVLQVHSSSISAMAAMDAASRASS